MTYSPQACRAAGFPPVGNPTRRARFQVEVYRLAEQAARPLRPRNGRFVVMTSGVLPHMHPGRYICFGTFRPDFLESHAPRFVELQRELTQTTHLQTADVPYISWEDLGCGLRSLQSESPKIRRLRSPARFAESEPELVSIRVDSSARSLSRSCFFESRGVAENPSTPQPCIALI